MRQKQKTINILRLLVISITVSFCFSSTYAQQADSSFAVTEKTETESPQKTTLTLAAIYSNNANYYGQVADRKIPYIALAATARFPFGAYVSALAYKLFSDSSFVSATALGAGYEFNITQKLKGEISYSHTFYPANSPFLQASNPDVLSAGISYKHLFTTGITFDYAIGKDASDHFLTLSNSKAFDFYTKNNKAIFSITTQIDITAGSQKFYAQYREKKNNKGGGKPVVPPGPPAIVTTNYSKFGILAYNFKLPLAYSRASYMLEAAYQLSVLGNNVASGAGSTHSFITLSAYYQF